MSRHDRERAPSPDETQSGGPSYDWQAIRFRLAAMNGREYWRSFEQLADTPAFQDYLRHEFPRQAGDWMDAAGRRHFLKLMAASLGLAGSMGCLRQPDEKIVPYVRQPEEVVPGKPLYFATAMPLGGYATGILVESQLGRPTKIEGNPDHPASLGATDAFTQAAILSLYDPDRSQTLMHRERIDTWSNFLTAMAGELPALKARQGRGLRILTETVTSPTLADQLRSLVAAMPEARWHQYEPCGRDNVRAGARLAFGEYVDTIYRFDRADVVVSLDADFLWGMPGSVRYARDFMDRRRVVNDDAKMNRLFAFESTPGLVGAVADHRLPINPSEVEPLARALAGRLKVELAARGTDMPANVPERFLRAVVSDLEAHRGASIVIAGDGQPAVVHALAHAINRQLDNVGQTIEYVEPVEARPEDQAASIQSLVDDMAAGEVDLLVILDGNPVYNTSAALDFAKHLSNVKLAVHLSQHYDETSFLCHWHIPAAHFLESWGDARAFDGTASIIQPLIAPLYSGRTTYELMSVLLGHAGQATFETVQQYWQKQSGGESFGRAWRKAVHDGLVPDTRAPTRDVKLSFDGRDPHAEGKPAGEGGVEVAFTPDPAVWDGRFANNGWLQELAKPLTKLTWDNAAYISPQSAENEQLANGDVVELSVAERKVDVPVWIVPGQPDGVVSLSLGYGRSRAGRIGTGVGFDAYSIRPTHGGWFAKGAQLRKTGQRYQLVVTQDHHSMEGRDLVQFGTFEEYRRDPNFLLAGKPSKSREESHHPLELPSLYPDEKTEFPQRKETDNAWGMVIDQTACTGCNACVIACQAENNTPIVGKEQVSRGREMQWLRIDRYYVGALDNPDTYFQPILCMHCENAPCELVCPVGATVHSSEGLNQMVYNRCVGTRYCSNNCPYKVRRFNFLNYEALFHYDGEPQLAMLRNPDVTVRSRGVMEKCSFCVQRIQEVKIEAHKANRPVADGEVLTACQQACPTRAIIFGNVNDPDSQVAGLKKSPLNYGLLAELNTRPRTTHLARLRNPHPDLAAHQTGDTPSLDPRDRKIDEWLKDIEGEEA
ncbi:MAG TPA: TAT-variant-translocated molybdopterin oxidoreductase [Pirellulales bacterium]|jgi:molybdopterin-containing oxidoreductase family iron-sulfur binding subunit|nr:TAT-variant-translocated molybdopterin oxidoreductase [Pirellulales bacterium]